MKISIGFLLVLFVTILNAQEVKHLNLEDAVLGYYKGLYPEQKSIQWIDDTDDFIIVENNSILVNYNLEKRPAIFTLTDLHIYMLIALPCPIWQMTRYITLICWGWMRFWLMVVCLAVLMPFMILAQVMWLKLYRRMGQA